MANGFSGTMDWILPDFAERFAAAGIAALAFDYRHLGESEGEPRQIINVRRQRRDLKRAVQLARSHAGIDPERIGLWGTSLGGSHAAHHASKDGRIAAVILNMPALDVVKGSNVKEKLRRMNVSRMEMLRASIRLLGAAARDAIQGALGLPRVMSRSTGSRARHFSRILPSRIALPGSRPGAPRGRTGWPRGSSSRLLVIARA